MPKVTAAVDLVQHSFYDRATSDPTLTTELGHSASSERIVLGRAADVFDKEDVPAAREFPLLPYQGITGPEFGGGYGEITVQCDELVWPKGAAGGIEKLEAIDAAILGLFHQQEWTYDGRRFFCRRVAQRPGPEPDLLHRIRELRIGIGG